MRSRRRVRPSRRQDDRGSALVIVLLFSLMATALCTTMLIEANADHWIVANERDGERALHAAWAGQSWGYHLYLEGRLIPGPDGAYFRSDEDRESVVHRELDGGSFAGELFDVSDESAGGQVLRLVVTGRYRSAERRTQMTFRIVPDALRFGHVAFDELALFNHGGLAGAAYRLNSTVHANREVAIPSNLIVDGTVHSPGRVLLARGATVSGDVFAHSVVNHGAIQGDVLTLPAVVQATGEAPQFVDRNGRGFSWLEGRSLAGDIEGDGQVLGEEENVTIGAQDAIERALFDGRGRLLPEPRINAASYLPPPLLDYRRLRDVAAENENTYFRSMEAAMRYLATKVVTEEIGGREVATIRVGTEEKPELLYVRGDFRLQLVGAHQPHDPARGIIAADGFHLQGGIYTTGTLSLNGPPHDPERHPPDYLQFSIDAVDHCYPAIIAYEEPDVGAPLSWSPWDTPTPRPGGPRIELQSTEAPHEGRIVLHGLTYSQGGTHLHHGRDQLELLSMSGAALGFDVHLCDYVLFQHDPAVSCTRFLVSEHGTPEIISHAELR